MKRSAPTTRACALLGAVLLAGCEAKGGSGGPTSAATASTSRFSPEAISIEQVRPLVPRITGARVMVDLEAVGPAVTASACLEDSDAMHAAQGVMDQVLAAGWESKPPRQTADPEIVAVDARRRPYLARLTLTHGGHADGGADRCELPSQVKLSWFISKNDASFGPR